VKRGKRDIVAGVVVEMARVGRVFVGLNLEVRVSLSARGTWASVVRSACIDNLFLTVLMMELRGKVEAVLYSMIRFLEISW